MQRSRLLAGAVWAVDELGYTAATVAHISARARVSRRTFYDLFENREECLLAVMEDALERIAGELDYAALAGLPWPERIRVGLSRILSFFDREPALARVCVVQSARGSRRVLERREEILTRLASAIDEGRRESTRATECPALTGEGLAGAAVSILYTRLLRKQQAPLGSLVGELTSMIVLPYLGPAAAQEEIERATPKAQRASKPRPVTMGPPRSNGKDPLAGLPMRITYRTLRALTVIAEHPEASNREISEYAGVSDQGQISKLLSRLERLGLIHNTGHAQPNGEPNAWRLTHKGEEIQQLPQGTPGLRQSGHADRQPKPTKGSHR